MKAIQVHLKSTRYLTGGGTTKTGRLKTRGIEIVLRFFSNNIRATRSVMAQLSRVPFYAGKLYPGPLTLGDEDLVDVAEERDAGYEYLRRWQAWSTKLHHELGLTDKSVLPDDTQGRVRLGRLVRENGRGCRMGIFCSKHNFIHGAEAADLRERLEKLIAECAHATVPIQPEDLQRLLEGCDARDSVAYDEIQHKRDAEDEAEASTP